jgi:hypothetical protein
MSGEPTLQAVEGDEIVETTRDTAGQVLGWRLEQLVAAGYDGEDAFALALDRNVDLHDAIELVRRGCPSRTATRILI